MKIHPPFITISALIGCSLFGVAADEKTDTSKQVQPPTTARILGDIPDGTPPPPEPPKPKFIVPAKDVLETKTLQQGGRTITVRKIAPIALPQKAKTAPPVDINDPAIQERVAEAREESSADELLCTGASVFRPKDSPPLSLVNIWPQGKGEPVVFWSSADFGFLSGVSNFTGSDGGTRSLFLMWGISEIENRASLLEELGPDAPQIPNLPPGQATFTVISGDPAPQTLVSIQSLHDIYNNDYDRLKAASEGRERANREREAELKAHPPKPQNVVIDYWHTERPAPAKGGVK